MRRQQYLLTQSLQLRGLHAAPLLNACADKYSESHQYNLGLLGVLLNQVLGNDEGPAAEPPV